MTITIVYLNKAGEKYKVFHRSNGEAWEHPYEGRRKCEACKPKKPRRGKV